MIHIPKQPVAAVEAFLPADFSSSADALAAKGSQVRDFVVRRPEASIAIGLVVGLVIGAWFKR
ncbi:hypothetical protein Pla108_16060 [Botrimarina colliarenosi]|uniref:DUF883 domain-containing protein n=1 Tax=Botrimarina colliarenosi TaxID=2528001 RepID=A0A5C6AR99_9BACT|nr:hypothetical protein [Botrimarina colliarenosi]TWU00654.1 hypothetical protein Pla108_16060 [Botrimarina colliarenosi]